MGEEIEEKKEMEILFENVVEKERSCGIDECATPQSMRKSHFFDLAQQFSYKKLKK